MSTTLLITTTQADFIPEIWLNEAFLRLREELFLVQNVTKDSELTGAFTVGDVLNMPNTGTLTVRQKTETGDITLDNPTDSNGTLTLNQHWYVAFGASSALKAQQNQDTLGAYMKDGIGQLAEKVESSLLGLYASASGSSGSAGVDVDESLVLTIRQAMNTAKAPKRGRFLVVGAKDDTAMLKIDRFTSAEKIGAAGKIAEGAIGRVHGFDVFQSNLVNTSGTSPISTYNMAFLRGGIVLSSRPLPPIESAISMQMIDPYSGLVFRVTKGYNSTANEEQIVIDALWGTAISRQAFVRVMLT